MNLSDEQINEFVSFILNNIQDVKKYINEHQSEYEDFLKEEVKKEK